ncbi:MAG: Stk1 family PASTA domain-containing Ser/Thr kinase [Oscillospiraceae bacterium]|nr:Stk1 family PASTA domain-containing Ser/Thr kinase [Oscillospiraceae bacterium]
MDKYIGRLLDNRYEILEVIGTGGMAVVYKARCHRLNRLVAIKILKDDFLEDEDFRRRFHAESQAVAQLSHPNIVSVYDVSTSISLEADYIVMELIDGITLKQYLEKKGVLNWKETLHFAIQIAKALEHAHSRGIVHRDIKPHNVMVLKNGSVKVADFGIARMMSQGNTLTKEALGSVHYISPEQAKGGRLDNRSDIYSLGVVMYEMMSGRPPYDGESPVAVAIAHINGGAVMPSLLNPNIPGGLEQIIMKAMAHNIEDRYTTATKMLADMDEFRKDPAILFDYNTPPLDIVTQLQKPPVEQPRVVEEPRPRPVPVRRTTAVKQQQRASGQRRDRRAADSRNRVATIAIIVCSLVAILAILVGLVVGFGGGCSSGNLIKVPYLVGEKFDEVQEQPGFNVKKDEVYDDKNEAGIIIGQRPKGGDQVVSGSDLVLIVSLGPSPKAVTMPNLVQEVQDKAIGVLKGLDMNLTYRFKQEYSETIPMGCVTRTEPAEGVELATGQEITLWISMGKEEKTSAMPNVIEADETLAKAVLENLQLKLDIKIERINDGVIGAGLVIRTDPEKGAELTEGQQVTLYISKGPETQKMPNVVGMSVDKASNLITGCGFKTPTIEFVESDAEKDTVVSQSHEKNVEIPLTSEIILEVSKGKSTQTVTKDVEIDLQGETTNHACHIKIEKNGEKVFDGEVPQGQATVTLKNQTGSGEQIYTIYVGGESWVQKVDFSANG